MEIIERFGRPAYDQNVEFAATDTEDIIRLLRKEGYECVEASALISMMAFSGRPDIEEIERLIGATERELGVTNQKHEKRIRIDPETGEFDRR